ncbi:hypothetical protein M2165_002172 [Variovorax sp. TBS-050B]|nr:hypothetical protein [Variovorax sp. TBS-050B]
MPQRGGAVGDRTLARQVAGGALEHFELVRNAALAVGVAEVRHERDLVHLRQRVEPRPRRGEALGREAQAVHARIHLEEHALRLECLVRREHVDLLVAVHRVPEVEARAEFEVARLEHAFEQQHRPAPAQRPHALGLVQVQQREAVGAAQPFVDPLDAMAIGIALDHGPDAGIDSRAPRAIEVVAERSGVHGGENGARHGESRVMKSGF